MTKNGKEEGIKIKANERGKIKWFYLVFKGFNKGLILSFAEVGREQADEMTEKEKKNILEVW